MIVNLITKKAVSKYECLPHIMAIKQLAWIWNEEITSMSPFIYHNPVLAMPNGI